MLQKAKPPMLHRRHQEPVRHEARQPLEVEGWRAALRRGDHQAVLFRRPWHFLVQLADFDGEEVVFRGVGVGVEEFLPLAHAKGCEGLGDGVGDAAKDLVVVSMMGSFEGWVRTYGVGDHDGEHRAVLVVGFELPHQDGDHGELEDEDYGVEEGLFIKRKRTRSALVHSQLRSSVCLCFTETIP